MRDQNKSWRAALSLLAFFLSVPVSAQFTNRFAHSTTLLPDGSLLVVGGQTDPTSLASITNDVQIMTAGGALTDLTGIAKPLSIHLASHTATLMGNGEVLVAGGINSAGTILTTAEVFNPAGPCWYQTPVSLAGGARFNQTATLLKTGQALLCGGRNNSGAMSGCELFTPTPGVTAAGDPTCAQTPGAFAATSGSLAQAREAHTATLLSDGRVFIAGGYNASASPSYLVTTEVFNPQTGAFASGPSLSIGRAFHTATMAGNGQVIVAGGFNSNTGIVNPLYNPLNPALGPLLGGYLNSAETCDISAFTCTPLQQIMRESRSQFASLLAPDGTLNVFGGLGNIAPAFPAISGVLNPGSTLNGTFGGILSSMTIANTTSLLLPVNLTLAVPASGVVKNGVLSYSSATIFFNGGLAALSSGTVSLNGAVVGCNLFGSGCGQIQQTLTLNPAGQYLIFPQTLQGNLAPTINGGTTINFSGTLNAGNPNVTITGGTIGAPSAPGNPPQMSPITIDGFPADFIGAHVSSGIIIVSSASIVQPSSFTVALNSMLGYIPGGTLIQSDGGSPPAGEITLLQSSWTNISGSIQYQGSGQSYSGSVTPPYSGSPNPQLQIGGAVAYISIDRVDLSGDTVQFVRTSTVVVNSMVFSDQEKYNPAANLWSFASQNASPQAAIPPSGSFFPAYNQTAILSPGGEIRLIGGQTCDSLGACATDVSLSTATVSFPLSNWQLEKSGAATIALSTSRAFHTSTLLPNGTILVAGGASGPNTVLSSAEIFDPIGQIDAPTASMRDVRDHHTATLLTNGRVLAAGGYTTTANSAATSHAEIYFPDEQLWFQTSPMSSPRADHSATLLANGDVLAVGGETNGNYLASAEIFLSTSQIWVPTSSANLVARAQHTATLLSDGRVLIVGGINSGGPIGTYQIYTPSTDLWTVAKPFPAALYGHRATKLLDGRVLITGGNNGSGEVGTAFLYNPGSDSWTQSPVSLTSARYDHTATLLPSGQVVVSGGASAISGNSIALSELYDVFTSSWQAIGNLTVSKAYQTTVLARDGYLYGIGGVNNNTNYLSTIDKVYLGLLPDANTLGAPPSLRLSTITALTPSLLQPAQTMTATGRHFEGVSEANGGGAASANSDQSKPRLILQAVDASGTGGGDFAFDLSTYIYANAANLWSQTDSSITVTLPANLPNGWYQARTASNAQYSGGVLIPAGPAKPSPVSAASLSGVAVSSTNIQWSWSAVSPADGYDVYSATSGIFLATTSAASFSETGLLPGTAYQISVAAFSMSGDGAAALSPSVTTKSSPFVINLSGNPASTTAIQWSWQANGATYYQVYNATAAVLIGTTTAPVFLDTGLSTNTARSIQVSAFTTGAGSGPLTAPVTVYTAAAVPVLSTSPFFSNLSTTSFTLVWNADGNPPSTQYQITVSSGFPSSTSNVIESTITVFNSFAVSLSSGAPSASFFKASVSALNGGGLASAALTFSTWTLPSPPTNLSIVSATPSSIAISWLGDNNSSSATYQVLYSSNDFATIQTAVSFSAGLSQTSATISGLITSSTYSIEVQAENPLGQTSAFSNIITTSPFNGGVAMGSLGLSFVPGQASSITGTLGNGQTVTLTVPGSAFGTKVLITISPLSIPPSPCGALGSNIGIQLTPSPALEPSAPLSLSFTYPTGALVTQAPSNAAIPSNEAVFEQVFPNGNCVPVTLATIDTAKNLVTSQLHHLSEYQVVDIPPASDFGGVNVYPNPFYPSRGQPYVTFQNMPAGARVRIFTVLGERVYDADADASGILQWTGVNRAGHPVASGVYLAVMEANGSKKILKVVVLR